MRLCACCSSSVLVRLQRVLLLLQGLGLALQLRRPGSCDCSSSSSVRIVAMIVLSTTPIVSVSCSRKVVCTSVKRREGAELDDAEHRVLEQHRQHDHVDRRGLAEARR